MIPAELKRLIFTNVPNVYTIQGSDITVLKTIGIFPLNDYSNAIVNIQFPLDTVQHYRSIDEMQNRTEDTLTHSKVYQGTIRFMIGADDDDTDVEEIQTYLNTEDTYTLEHSPVLSITSIISGGITFILNTDYIITDDHTQIQWIGNTPVNEEPFTIVYTFRQRGYWIASEIAEYLGKWIELNFPQYLHLYGASIINISNTVNLTEVVGIDLLNLITFDVNIRYTFEWSRALVADSDDTVLSSITLTIDSDEYSESHEIS